jgi:hypothetical protein
MGYEINLSDFLIIFLFLNSNFQVFPFILGHQFFLLTIYLNLKSTQSNEDLLLVEFISCT